MIRTFITPTKRKYSIDLEFPEDYLGQELELIIFKKQEGIITQKNTTQKKKPSDFFGTLSQEEGEKIQAYITQSRNEWDRSI